MKKDKHKCKRWRPTRYRIRVKGHLDPSWSTWFDGLEISPDSDGETVLSGLVADQPALHGLLKKIRDLGLDLITVEQMESKINRKEIGFEEE